MWTKEKLDQFLVENQINTGGALTPYKVDIVEKEDGDVWYEATFPFFPNNEYVIRGVLSLALKALNIGGVTIYLDERKEKIGYPYVVKINFYSHCCDPS